MDYEKIFGLILDLGSALVNSGAEVHRAEDTMYRLLEAYGFENPNVWLVPTNIQATVILPGSGKLRTQIRHVRAASINFNRFDKLNDLSRHLCANPVDAPEFRRLLNEALDHECNPVWLQYIGAMLGGPFYALFFGCEPTDLICAALTSALILFIDRHTVKTLGPLLRNFITTFFAGLFILACARFGWVVHPGSVTTGVIILVVSALGVTNALRDFVCLDSLSGVINITAAVTGALGIGLGICAAIQLLGDGTNLALMSRSTVPEQLIASTVSSIGFALLFHIKSIKKLVCCALGGLAVWAVYLFASAHLTHEFISAICAAMFCAVYAQIMARFNRAPATVFMTIGMFPLIPGSALYRTMYGIVRNDTALAATSMTTTILVCFAIALGFLASDSLGRSLAYARGHAIGHRK
ncbi:MAG: threonine/serine exporter family protein [Clostridia bacterium]|nr:threonine/serine exporter family protein [Clostridia bacterium]